jgi:predicted nucleotidyltransferase
MQQQVLNAARLHIPSYARGTAIREASDVDVIADFDQAKGLSLLGPVHLENRLTDILGVFEIAFL